MELEKIITEAERVLAENQNNWSPLWGSWADALLDNAENIRAAKTNFRERPPLRIYMPIGKAKENKKKCRFALRYFGKDVAEIETHFDGKTPPYLLFDDTTENHKRNNRKSFGMQMQEKKFKAPWDSKPSAEFRKFFKDLQPPHTVEHMLESMVLDEMEKKTNEKFEGTLRHIQPVKLFNEVRFQMKVPFSANEGIPNYSINGGGIDILARIGSSQDTNLAVLELKNENKPAYKKAIAQSIIYSIGVISLLRDKNNGLKWWNLFGFKRALPETINIFAVPTIPFSIREEFEKEKTFLGVEDGTQIKIGQDQITLGHIFFEQTKNNRIEIKGVGGLDNIVYDPKK